MSEKSSKLLNGLDGNRVMLPQEAIKRIRDCANHFGIIAVKVLDDGGKVLRECTAGTGHRPAITHLEQASPEQKVALVVTPS